MARLLHAHDDIAVRVQERRDQAQAAALQHLHVQRRTLRVRLQRPHLRARHGSSYNGRSSDARAHTALLLHIRAQRLVCDFSAHFCTVVAVQPQAQACQSVVQQIPWLLGPLQVMPELDRLPLARVKAHGARPAAAQ